MPANDASGGCVGICQVALRRHLTIEQLGALWRPLEILAKPSFFLSWHWVGCWLRQSGISPAALVATVSGKIIGLALFHHGRSARPPYLVSHHLTSSGHDGFDSVFVEYNDFLTAPSDAPIVRLAFQSYFAKRAHARLHLPGVDDAMLALWRDPRFFVRIETSRSAPYVDLAALRQRGQGYLASRSANARQQIRRSMRLYESDGPLVLEAAADLDDAQAIFEDLKRLHQISWRARGCPGAFATPFFETFHRALVREAWPTGHVHLLRLRAGPRIIGCLYNFVKDGKAYAYQSGFAEDADSRRKPGLTAHAMAAEHYLDAGLDRYLLLAGDSRYKTTLASQADRLNWIVVRQTGWLATLEDWAERAARKMVG